MQTSLKTVVAILVGASCASADIITQTLSAPNHIPPGDHVLTFDQFDTSLGTLDSIQIILSLSTYGGSVQLDNDAELPISGIARLGVSAVLSSTDVALLNGALIPQNVWTVASTVFDLIELDGTDGDSTGQFDLGTVDYGELYGPNALTPAEASVGGFVGDAFFAAYQGTETYDISFTDAQIQEIFSGGYWAQVSPANSFGSVTVIYNYTPIPEPATASLAGLAALMLLRRRRRA